MKSLPFLLFFLLVAGCAPRQQEDILVAIQVQDRNQTTETISAPDRLDAYRDIDFSQAQPYKKILRVYKQGAKHLSKITTYHANGQLWQYLEAEELRAHGLYREWFPNGQLRIEAHVIGGTADVAQGVQRDWLFDQTSYVWDEKGNLLAEIPYRQGVLEGISLYYYPSGQIEKKLPFLQNNLEGEAVESFPNGKIRSKTHYHQGTKEGPSFGFFSNGQIAWQEEFSNGLLVNGIYFDPQGKLLSEVIDGMGFQSLYENDQRTHLAEIFQGLAEGSLEQFSPQGELVCRYFLKNGLKQGEEIAFFLPHEIPTPRKEPMAKLSVTWDRDKIHGPVKTWYDNGQIASQREYAKNQKNGTSITWYKDGSLMSLEEYEDNHLLKGQYYKKHQKEPVSTVLNGNGVATIYDENGIFLQKVIYAKGEIVHPEE